MNIFRFAGGNIATASGVINEAEIRVERGRIAAITPLTGTTDAVELAGGWVLPGSSSGRRETEISCDDRSRTSTCLRK